MKVHLSAKFPSFWAAVLWCASVVAIQYWFGSFYWTRVTASANAQKKFFSYDKTRIRCWATIWPCYLISQFWAAWFPAPLGPFRALWVLWWYPRLHQARFQYYRSFGCGKSPFMICWWAFQRQGGGCLPGRKLVNPGPVGPFVFQIMPCFLG